MKRQAIPFIISLFLFSPYVMAQEDAPIFTAAWWNVENLFDTRNDPNTNDDEFTPSGDLHWTQRKMWKKLNDIYKTIVAMNLPDVIGFAEVENKYVLRSLCEGTPLKQAGYRYVHYDSPDRRGIDVALIYRTSRFTVDSSQKISLSDSATHFFTRDILYVKGHTHEGDTIVLLLNHWPSKRGGEEAEEHRIMAARKLRSIMQQAHKETPSAAIIAMGDLNSTDKEPPLAEGMAFGNDSINPDGIRLLTHRLPRDWGSHKYQGEWCYIDQVLLLANEHWNVVKLKLIHNEYLVVDEVARPGQRPKRTYQGPLYEGGISDHLPLLLRLRPLHDNE